MNSGGEFLHREHEPAVTTDRNDGSLRFNGLDAQRGRKRVTQGRLVSRTHDGPRPISRHRVAHK